MWVPEQLWVWILMGIWLQKGVEAACTMAEFPCRNQQCISLDKYCDGKRDCNDGSDEPTGCSPCNRTYYGRVGATYKLKVPKPSRGALPHFCQLTFMASGAQYGDLVQISIDKFNLGRFISHTTNGCPDGYMQIEELSRPSNTGYWCGSSWGHNTYYSETSSVSVMIRVFNLSEQSTFRPLTMQSEENVLLELSYRYLIQEKAVLRYGVPYGPSFLGQDITGTFCDKLFEDCDKKNCKVQSPNYPGMYPRNLTCYYHIKQTNVPEDKVSLISIRQKNPHLIYIKDRNAPHLSRDVKFQLKDACHVIHDYLVIYDGNSTQDPILLKACKGGALSPITSSGSEMLILFHVSPFDFPFQDAPRRKVFGFQLQVDVMMVARESTAYVRHYDRGRVSTFYPSVPSSTPYSCKWHIDSKTQRSGYVQAPVHSILPNTTCTWRLSAGYSEIVWLYFLHFRHVKHTEMPNQTACPNILTVFDGNTTKRNATLLGNFCRKDRFPRVCSGVHAPSAVGATAPCSASESYVSITSALTLNLAYNIGTIPSHIEFLARYEFVDKRQWGTPTPGGNYCDRTFKMRPDKLFASPRDIFLFGRGGNRALHCTYTFKVAHHQRVYIRLLRSKIGRTCRTVHVDASNRFECSHGGSDHLPSIKIQETIWDGVPFNRACVCNVSDHEVSVRSYTNEIKIVFNVPDMTPSEDFNDYYFEGEYEIFEAKRELLCDDNDRRHIGNYGNFSIGPNTNMNPCNALPRIVNAQDGAFLYMKAEGYLLDKRVCDVQSRINIYGAGKAMPMASVCPSINEHTAYVFSNGWNSEKFKSDSNGYLNSLGFYGQGSRNFTGGYWTGRSYRRGSRYIPGSSVSRDIVIEYVGNTSGNYLLSWVGVWKPLRTAPLSSAGADLCPHQCPEIQACLPQELWCDGNSHCPSEIDEGASACGILAALPWVSLAVVLALITSLLILLAAVMKHRKQIQEVRRKSIDISTVQNNGHGIKSATTEELLIPSDNDSAW